MVADPQWLVTLTFSQPDASAPIPERHAQCRADTHVYEYRDGTYRWRVMGTCQHCCRNVSAMLTKWRKRVRRLFGDQVQIITAKEDHKSGALHIHLGLCGLPPYLTRDQRAVLKQHWEDLGGGYSDYSPRRSRRGETLGFYLGKYIAKRHDQKMSRGFRRWSRTAGFAPEIAMRVPPPPGWVPPDWAYPLAELRHVGWQHPVTKETVPDRYWPD